MHATAISATATIRTNQGIDPRLPTPSEEYQIHTLAIEDFAPPGEPHAAPPATAPTSIEDILRPVVARLIDEGHPELLDRLVNIAVREAFQMSGANQIKTASALGVTRNVVRTHLKNFGLI